jgi:hypothetical protein
LDAEDESDVGVLEQAASAVKLITIAARLRQTFKDDVDGEIEVVRVMASSRQSDVISISELRNRSTSLLVTVSVAW